MLDFSKLFLYVRLSKGHLLKFLVTIYSCIRITLQYLIAVHVRVFFWTKNPPYTLLLDYSKIDHSKGNFSKKNEPGLD